MPYSVKVGEVHDGDKHYRCGEFVPGPKGSLADMEAAGAVEWIDAPVRETAKKAEPAKPVEPENIVFKGGGKVVKRKAVNP
jgi:hypothetical protein